MTETDHLYRLSRQIDYWGRKIAELREIADCQVARWFAKAGSGRHDREGKAEVEPKLPFENSMSSMMLSKPIQ